MIFVFFILGIPVVIMLGFVLPLWAFADALGNPELTRAQRVLWRFLCLILWGLGSAIYGVARGRSRAFRRASASTLAGTVILVFLYTLMVHKS